MRPGGLSRWNNPKEVFMFENKNNTRHGMALTALLTLSGMAGTAWADAYEDAAKKWVESEFNPSTRSRSCPS